MATPSCRLAATGNPVPDETPREPLSAGPAQRLAILRRFRRIAMVGLSANPLRPSHFVAIYLARRGYDILPVNPRETEILGRRCYPSLRAVEGPIEVVDIFRDSRHVPGIVDEAIEVGAKVVWMQFGVLHADAACKALEAGLEVVMDKCLKVEHARFEGGLTSMGLRSGVISSNSWGKPDGKPSLP